MGAARMMSPESAREKDVLSFADTIRYQSFALVRDKPHVSAHDLQHDAFVALLECYDRDPQKFSTVAPYFLRRALWEGISRQTGESLKVRRFLILSERARYRLRIKLWRVPTDAEVAAEMGLTLESYSYRCLTGRIMRTLQGRAYDPAAAHWGGRVKPVKNYRSPTTKLTWEQVGEIRRRAAANEPRASLCRAFGICKTQMAQIIRGESWIPLADDRTYDETA